MMSLTWPEAARVGAQDGAIGLIATAAVEQHGPHLPLATDFLIAQTLAPRVADGLIEPVLVAPVVPGGLSTHHLAFPGSVDLAETVFEGAIDAYVAAFQRVGVRQVALISCHGGNFPLIGRYAAARTQDAGGPRVIAYDDLQGYVRAMNAGAARAGLTVPECDMHAGGLETSQMLASHPTLVRCFAGVTGYTENEPGWPERALDEGLDAITPSGVLGDVTGASAVVGEQIYAELASTLASWIADAFGATTTAAARSPRS
jgi:creatinine amidohydrolase